MKEFIRLLKVAEKFKWIMAFTTLIGFLTIGSSIGLLMVSAWLISKAAIHTPLAFLQVSVVGVRFFGISRGVLRYSERLLSHNTTFKLLAKFRVWFYEAIEPLAPAGLAKFRSGDLLARIVADVENLEHIYIRIIYPPIVAVGIILMMYFIFGFFSPIISVIIVITLLLAGIFVPNFTKRIGRNLGKQLVETRTKLNILSIDLTQGLTELIVFNEREKFEKEYKKTSRRLNYLQFKMFFIDGLNESLITLVMNISLLFTMIYAIPEVAIGNLTGINLAVLIVGTMSAFEAVLPIPTMIHHLETSISSGRRIFEIIDEKSTIDETESKKNNISYFSIKFDNVNFGYEQNKIVLKNANFEIKSNEKIVIVGQSGSGKSTIINLLFRFWDVNSGKILIGSENVKSLNLDYLRSKMALVSQNSHFFNGTILQNLQLAKENLTEEEIQSVLEKVKMSDKINTLPEKINTWVGENGIKLSGGEKQRLAIARMLLKDAEILVFDEPTANLDSLNEKSIFEMIFEVSANKTLVFITHRLLNLEKFDKILVMKDGEIIGDGNPTEIIKTNSHLIKLLESQNQQIL